MSDAPIERESDKATGRRKIPLGLEVFAGKLWARKEEGVKGLADPVMRAIREYPASGDAQLLSDLRDLERCIKDGQALLTRWTRGHIGPAKKPATRNDEVIWPPRLRLDRGRLFRLRAEAAAKQADEDLKLTMRSLAQPVADILERMADRLHAIRIQTTLSEPTRRVGAALLEYGQHFEAGMETIRKGLWAKENVREPDRFWQRSWSVALECWRREAEEYQRLPDRAGAGKPTGATDPKEPEGRAEPRAKTGANVHASELAMAILFQEPEISPTELAERVGVSRSTLYSRSPKWKAVRQTLKARDSSRIPRGTKSRNGHIEAEYDPAKDCEA